MPQVPDAKIRLLRPMPAPPVTLESLPFWEAAKDGRFLVKRCADCREVFWYPRATCPLCHFEETEWVESPGLGTVYSFTIVRNMPSGPFALAYVNLDEGVTLLTNIVDAEEDEIAIGMRVRVRFVPTMAEGEVAPVFTPVRSTGL